jgi:DNA-binding IclR family transcriptional regulator
LRSDAAIAAGGLGVLRIAEETGQDKSQISRTLKSLAEAGLVDRDPDTLAYRLGWGLYALAARAGDGRLLSAGAPTVQELVRVVGERAHLTVLQGAEVLTVLSESPPHAIQATGWVGRTVPVYCSSSGRALLTDHTPERVRALLAGVQLVRAGPNTPGTLDELLARIEQARACGYALTDEEFEVGLVGAAAPVRDFRGAIVAALNVSGPKFRLGPRLDDAGRAVAGAAAGLSALLGWSGDALRAAASADGR